MSEHFTEHIYNAGEGTHAREVIRDHARRHHEALKEWMALLEQKKDEGWASLVPSAGRAGGHRPLAVGFEQPLPPEQVSKKGPWKVFSLQPQKRRRDTGEIEYYGYAPRLSTKAGKAIQAELDALPTPPSSEDLTKRLMDGSGVHLEMNSLFINHEAGRLRPARYEEYGAGSTIVLVIPWPNDCADEPPQSIAGAQRMKVSEYWRIREEEEEARAEHKRWSQGQSDG